MEMSIGFLMRYVWSHGFEKQNCHESTCEEGAERGAGRRGGGGTSPQKIQTALQQNEQSLRASIRKRTKLEPRRMSEAGGLQFRFQHKLIRMSPFSFSPRGRLNILDQNEKDADILSPFHLRKNGHSAFVGMMPK